MRLPALATILTLGVLITLSDDKAPGAGTGTSSRSSTHKPPPSPPARPPVSVPRRGGYNFMPRIPVNFRPGHGARLVPLNIDVNFTFNSDIGKVRPLDPPTEFDEKGNVKKHTAQELKALKGDDPEEKKLPGYKTEISEVQVGDIVQVSLSVHKLVAKKKPKAKKKNKDTDNDKDKEADKEEDMDKTDKEMKWVVATKILGKVTKVESANTDSAPKLTIRITTVQVAQGNAKPNGDKNITIKAEEGQATLIVTGHRPPEATKP